MVARVSFDAASESGPLDWVDVSDRLRSFGISRGGENELDLIDTGTCQVTLDNRDRALDPFNTSSPYSPNVKPRRRLWLQSQFAGLTTDQFYGWTGAFTPDWPAQGHDAVVGLAAQDAFAILSGDALPTTSPPRNSYAEVVAFDRPAVHLRLEEASPSVALENAGTILDYSLNGVLTAANYLVQGMIVGEQTTMLKFTDADGASVEPTTFLTAPQTQLTSEFWIRRTNTDAETVHFIGSGVSVSIQSNKARFTCNGVFVETTTELAVDVPYYVAATYDGTNVRIYLNGVLEDSDTTSGIVLADILEYAGGAFDAYLDEVAFYQVALSAARISAHYTAGALRGRAQERVDNRLAALMEASGLGFVPRRLRTAARNVQATYYAGQTPKSEIEAAVQAEGDPSMCYFGKDGALVFLDRAHRSASPWNTVQATFDDDGTDLPYLDLKIDDGEAFIYNDVRVTARGGTLQQSTDTASIAEYQRRVLDRGETLNVSDTDADTEADALLAKYKDPLARITALTLKGADEALVTAFLAGELGDCIRVFRRPMGGGSAIDQTSFIRKIDLSGDATSPFWTCQWAVAKR